MNSIIFDFEQALTLFEILTDALNKYRHLEEKSEKLQNLRAKVVQYICLKYPLEGGDYLQKEHYV